MFNRRALTLVAMGLAALALPATALAIGLRAAVKRAPAKKARMPASTPSGAASEIGALYANTGATQHQCTASVVDSPRGNTLITAAHCVSGSGAGIVFEPGQDGARARFGRWTVTAAHVEPEWATRQDPHADVAFLTVAPQTINGNRTEIQQVTGGYALGSTALRGQRVTVTGYPAGGANSPITCATKVYLTAMFPSFDCRGYVDGTSGSPWLLSTRRGQEIVGVIGGLHQGGCYDYTSYSSPLTHDADNAYVRAADDAPADVAPQPGGDGC